MNIHLLASPETVNGVYENVIEILTGRTGLLNFISAGITPPFSEREISAEKFDKKKFRRKQTIADVSQERVFYNASYNTLYESIRPDYPKDILSVEWKSIFAKCENFRLKNNLSSQDHVFLLMGYSNDKNWFSGWDPTGKKNAFVQANQWEFFISCDARFPVSYEVLVTLLQSFMFDRFEMLVRYMHRKPRGCINDYCEDKKDVALKLRTADICANCLELLAQKAIDPRIIDHVFSTLENIRAQMLFRERYKTTLQPGRVEVRGREKRIFFPDLANSELKLTPLERTVYLLFLMHPEGLRLSEISDYRRWIVETYREIGNSRTTAEFHNSIEQLINPTENSLSEKISRIKSKLIALLGEDLASHYIIEGPRDAVKKIKLKRELVTHS